MLTQTIAQDKYNIHGSETIVVGSFFISSQFQKLVSTFFKNKKNLVTIFFFSHFIRKMNGKNAYFQTMYWVEQTLSIIPIRTL